MERSGAVAPVARFRAGVTAGGKMERRTVRDWESE